MFTINTGWHPEEQYRFQDDAEEQASDLCRVKGITVHIHRQLRSGQKVYVGYIAPERGSK